MKKLLCLTMLVGLTCSVQGAASVRVSGIPTTNNAVSTAYLIINTKILGHATNDTFVITVADFFQGIGTSTTITNLYLNQVISNLFSTTVWIDIDNYNTYINGTNIVLNGTNVAVVNPTDGRVPYRINQYQFGDSPWHYYSTNTMGFADGTVLKAFLQRWGGLAGDESWGMGESALGYGGALIGGGNIGLGKRSLLGIRAGTYNLGYGSASLQALTTGSYNLGIGPGAGQALTTEDANTLIGYQTWVGRHGSNNISIGFQSNDTLTDTVTNTITIATQVGTHTARATNSGDILIGNDLQERLIMPGLVFLDGNNAAFGRYAVASLTSGTGNTFSGAAAGYGVTSGLDNVFNGQGAGYYITTGKRNVYVGTQSGGSSSGADSDNILIGWTAGTATAGITNTIVIAGSLDGSNGARATNSGDILLGNAANTRLIVPIPSWGSGDGTRVYRNDGTFGALPSAGLPVLLTAQKAFQAYQGSLTHAGTVTVDLDAMATVNSLVTTGNLTLAWSNLGTNRTARLNIRNPQATNCTLTLPAGTQGYYTATLSNGWHMLSVEAWGTVASNVWVSASSNGTY